MTSLVQPTPARRLRDALEPLAAQGFMGARDDLKALGLRFIQGYVWGRAAALGEPAPPVVVSAFGVFEPTFLVQAYDDARAIASRDDVLAARAAGASRQLASILGNEPDVERLSSTLRAAFDGVSATARPLFAGLRSLSPLDSPPGALWQVADLAREHRGDGHLSACVAAGLDPVEMNVLTELYVGYPLREFSSTRGWSAEQVGAAIERLRARGLIDGDALSTTGAAFRHHIERATDASQVELVDALGDGLDWVVATANRFAAQVVAAGAFTDDIRKRAAG